MVGLSRRSIENYKVALKHWQTFVGPMPVEKITSKVIAGFQHVLLQRMASATVNAYLRPIKALLRFAADEDSGRLIQKAPKIRMLKEPRRVPLALTLDEFSKVLDTSRAWPGEIGGSPAGAWWLALLLVAWETGLRYTALLSIRTIDFVPESGGLYCQPETQKDNEGMWFQLTPDALRAVLAIYNPDELLLFHSGVKIETVGRWFRKVLDDSGIYAPKGCGMRFHRIRKSKASYTKTLGGDAQAALGHSDSSVTKRYFDPRIVKPVKQPTMPSPDCPHRAKILLPGPIALLPRPETTKPRSTPEGEAAA
ncbi:MAG: tyrosine-type recombinase/integrase [Thermoguttaceae bacterium]